jgi:hypothetical protein
LLGASFALHRKWRNYKDEHAEYEKNKQEVKAYRKHAVGQSENFTDATKDYNPLSPYSPMKDRYNDSVLSRSSKGRSIIASKTYFPS